MLYQTKNPHGGDIYTEPITLDCSANTNPLGTPQGVLDAMRQALPKTCHYPDPCCRELVRAISEYESVPEAYILCGNGAAELIYSYCQAVRPRRAAELAPTFSEYALGLERVGCQVERYRLERERSFDLGEDFLPWLEARRPEAVFLCSPNNPTGRLIDPALIERILAYCRRSNARLFLDECFLDLSEGGVSVKGLLREYPELFLLKAFTKNYALAGIRLGYGLCADSALLEEMSRTVQPWNVSVLAQAAGVAALGEREYLRKARALIPAERRWLKDRLEALGFWVCPSAANYLLFHGEAGLDTALKARGIAIRGCENYYGLGPGWYRTAVRLHEENVRLISAIEARGKEREWQKTS